MLRGFESVIGGLRDTILDDVLDEVMIKLDSK